MQVGIPQLVAHDQVIGQQPVAGKTKMPITGKPLQGLSQAGVQGTGEDFFPPCIEHDKVTRVLAVHGRGNIRAFDLQSEPA